MLDASEILSAAQLHHFEATQGPRIAAAGALDPEGSLETNEIGGGTDVLGGHRSRLTHEEQDGNKVTCGKRAKRQPGQISSASESARASSNSTPR